MITRRSLLTQLGLLGAAGGAAWWLRDRVFWPRPRVIASGDAADSGWVPFVQADRGMVIVPTLVNGATVLALLDSGAQTSVIDTALARRLGLPVAVAGPLIVAFGVSGGPQLARAATLDLRLGDLTLQGLRAALLDLGSLSRASGRDFSLILGQDVLRSVVADIDFPAERVAFHTPERYRLPDGASVSEARMEGREMLVPVIVEAVPLEVVLDTGASSALALSAETARAAGLLSGRPVGSAPSLGLGGLSQGQVIRARSFTFAGRAFGEVPVHIYQPGAARVPSGLLGVEALRAFRVIIDLGRARLHLAPSTKSARRRSRVRRPVISLG